MRRWLALAGWLGFIGLSIALLHRSGRWFPSDLVLEPGGPLEPTLAAGLRLVGLSVGYWLAGSTILYLIGRASQVPAAIRTVRWTTIGPVRRLIDRIVSGALVATIGLPANAMAMIDPGYVPVPAGDRTATDAVADNAGPPGQVDDAMPDHGPIVPGVGPLPTQSVTDPPIVESTVSPDVPLTVEAIEVVVRPGDHMWALAEQRLTLVRGRAVSDAEIALYWVQVIAINLSRIRSADPDLIYPGEILVLPAIDS